MYAGERVEFLALQGLHLVPHGTELLPPCTRATTAVSVVVTNYRVLLQFLGLTRDKKTRPPISIPLMAIQTVQRGSTSSEAYAIRQDTINTYSSSGVLGAVVGAATAGMANGGAQRVNTGAGASSSAVSSSMFNTSTDYNNPFATPNPINSATGAIDPFAFTGDPLLWVDIVTKQGYAYRLAIRTGDSNVQFVASLFDNELASQAVREQQALQLMKGGASSPLAGNKNSKSNVNNANLESSPQFTSMAFSPVREMMRTLATDLLTSSSSSSSSSDDDGDDVDGEARRLFTNDGSPTSQRRKRRGGGKSAGDNLASSPLSPGFNAFSSTALSSGSLASVVSSAGAGAPSFIDAQPAATVSDVVDAATFMAEFVKAMDRAVPRRFTDFFAFSHFAALRNAALTVTLEKAVADGERAAKDKEPGERKRGVQSRAARTTVTTATQHPLATSSPSTVVSPSSSPSSIPSSALSNSTPQSILSDASLRLRSLEQMLVNHYAEAPSEWQPPGMKGSVRLSIVASLGLPSAADALLLGLNKTLPNGTNSNGSGGAHQQGDATHLSPEERQRLASLLDLPRHLHSKRSHLPMPQAFAKDMAKCHDSSWGAFNVMRSLYRMTVADVPEAKDGVGLSTNLLQWFHVFELVGGRSLAAAVETASQMPPLSLKSLLSSTAQNGDRTATAVACGDGVVLSSSPIGLGNAFSSAAAIATTALEFTMTTDAERRFLCDVVHDAEVTRRSCLSMHDLLTATAVTVTSKKDEEEAVGAEQQQKTDCAQPLPPILCPHHSRLSKPLGQNLLSSSDNPSPSSSAVSQLQQQYVPIVSHPQMAVQNANDLRQTFSTYPTAVILPKRAGSIDTIAGCAKYRQNGRIPSISWIHIDTGACLSRSSQPRVGGGRNSREDQLVLSYMNQALHAEDAAIQHFKTQQRKKAEAMAAAKTAANGQLAGGSGGSSSAASPSRPRYAPPSLMGGRGGGVGATQQQPQQQQQAPPPSLFGGSGAVGSSSYSVSVANGASPSHKVTTISINNNNQNGGASDGVTSSPPSAEDRMLHILDCRSVAAATTNMAAGGGYELVQNYQRAKIHFMNLDNIHGVRKAFERLTRLVQQTQCGDSAAMPRALRQKIATSTGNALMLDMTSSSNDSASAGAAFWTRLEATEWPTLVQRLLWSATKCCGYLQKGDSVLVHCTDGWDRTSQVVTLSMLMLDAHYRTIEGFCELLQREWLEYGHRFADRCGHYRKGGHGTNTSSSSSSHDDGDASAATSSSSKHQPVDGIASVLLSDTATLINKYTLMAAAERRHKRDQKRKARQAAAAAEEEAERIRLAEEAEEQKRLETMNLTEDQALVLERLERAAEENGLNRDSSIYVPVEENPLLAATTRRDAASASPILGKDGQTIVPPSASPKINPFTGERSKIRTEPSKRHHHRSHSPPSSTNHSGEPSKRQQFAALGTEQPPPLIRSVSDGRFQTKGSTTSVGPRISGKEHEQTSPVFIQFLDAVYQLLRMYPSHFEFTPYFLSYLCEQVYGCRFGTFLKSCHRDRVQEQRINTRAFEKAKQTLHMQQQQKAFQRKARAELAIAEAKERARLARQQEGGQDALGGDAVTSDHAFTSNASMASDGGGAFDLIDSFSNFDAHGQLLAGSINSKNTVGLPTFEDVASCCLRDGQYAALATTTASVWGEIEELVLRERLYPHLVPETDRFINILFDPSRHIPNASATSQQEGGSSDATNEEAKYQPRTAPAPHTSIPLIPSIQPRNYYFWNSFFAKPHAHFTDFWHSLAVLDAGYGPLGYSQFHSIGLNGLNPFNVGGGSGGGIASNSGALVPSSSGGGGFGCGSGGDPENISAIVAMFLASSRLNEVYKTDGEKWLHSLQLLRSERMKNNAMDEGSSSLSPFNNGTVGTAGQQQQPLLLPQPAPHLLGFLFHMFRHRAHVLQMLLPTAAVAGVHPDSSLAQAAKRLQQQNLRKAELLAAQQKREIEERYQAQLKEKGSKKPSALLGVPSQQQSNGGTSAQKKNSSLLSVTNTKTNAKTDASTTSTGFFTGVRKPSSSLAGKAAGGSQEDAATTATNASSAGSGGLAQTILSALRGGGGGSTTPQKQQSANRKTTASSPTGAGQRSRSVDSLSPRTHNSSACSSVPSSVSGTAVGGGLQLYTSRPARRSTHGLETPPAKEPRKKASGEEEEEEEAGGDEGTKNQYASPPKTNRRLIGGASDADDEEPSPIHKGGGGHDGVEGDDDQQTPPEAFRRRNAGLNAGTGSDAEADNATGSNVGSVPAVDGGVGGEGHDAFSDAATRASSKFKMLIGSRLSSNFLFAGSPTHQRTALQEGGERGSSSSLRRAKSATDATDLLRREEIERSTRVVGGGRCETADSDEDEDDDDNDARSDESADDEDEEDVILADARPVKLAQKEGVARRHVIKQHDSASRDRHHQHLHNHDDDDDDDEARALAHNRAFLLSQEEGDDEHSSAMMKTMVIHRDTATGVNNNSLAGHGDGGCSGRSSVLDGASNADSSASDGEGGVFDTEATDCVGLAAAAGGDEGGYGASRSRRSPMLNSDTSMNINAMTGDSPSSSRQAKRGQPPSSSSTSSHHTTPQHGYCDDEANHHHDDDERTGYSVPSTRPRTGSWQYGNRNGGILRTDFIPRSTANNCELCLVPFTFFYRRHCCRRCCRATCDKCSSNSVLLAAKEIGLYEDKNMTKTPLRVCTDCYEATQIRNRKRMGSQGRYIAGGGE